MQMKKAAVLLAALAFVAGCDDDDDPLGPTNSASIQFVNASAGSTVTGAAGSQAVGSALTFQSGSLTCQYVSPGAALQFAENGTAVATSSAQVVAGQRYTAVLMGTGTARTMIVVPEVYTTQTTGNYGLRFINATSQTGNIFVTTPTGTVSGTANATLTSGTATGGTTGTNGYQTFALTNTRVRFFGAASASTPLADFTVANPVTAVGTTVVFANDATGNVVAFSIPQCVQA